MLPAFAQSPGPLENLTFCRQTKYSQNDILAQFDAKGVREYNESLEARAFGNRNHS